MTHPYECIVIITGFIALLSWMVVACCWDEDRQATSCHGETDAPQQPNGNNYVNVSFDETIAYVTSAVYRQLTK